MSKHTATPWDYFVGNANGRGLVRIEAASESADAGSHIASMARGAVSEANAAHIVRCVNNFDALVEALKLIAAQDQGCGGRVTEAEAWRSAQSIARAALSAARSEP